ncbi:MAG: hypothetical protein WCG47_24625 [Dermatophilaceae bacterium]
MSDQQAPRSGWAVSKGHSHGVDLSRRHVPGHPSPRRHRVQAAGEKTWNK